MCVVWQLVGPTSCIFVCRVKACLKTSWRASNCTGLPLEGGGTWLEAVRQKNAVPSHCHLQAGETIPAVPSGCCYLVSWPGCWDHGLAAGSQLLTTWMSFFSHRWLWTRVTGMAATNKSLLNPASLLATRRAAGSCCHSLAGRWQSCWAN